MITGWWGKLKNENQRLPIDLNEFDEFITDGYWDWHLQADPPYEYLSDQFKRQLGYEPNELENTPEVWQRLIFPEDKEKALESYKEHVEEGKPYNLKVRYKHKEGHTVWVICRGKAVFDDKGKPYRMIGCHQDITDLMNVRRELDTAMSLLDSLPKNRKKDSIILALLVFGLGVISYPIIKAIILWNPL